MMVLTIPIGVTTTIEVNKDVTHAKIRQMIPNFPDREPNAREIAGGKVDQLIAHSRGTIGYPTIDVAWAIGETDRDGVFVFHSAFKATIPHPDANAILTRVGDPTEASDLNARRAVFDWLANHGYPELVGVVT